MVWPCFWAERTDQAEVSLRRYISGEKCGEHSYHNASVSVGRMPVRLSEHDGRQSLAFIRPKEYRDDPRWPTKCDRCDREFGPMDEQQWSGVSQLGDGAINAQVNQELIFRRTDTGEEWPQDHLPAGAMFEAWWMSSTQYVGPDGMCLAVITPYPADQPDNRGGVWLVDGPATNNPNPGPAWTRTGDPRNPPTLTCNPSIKTPYYHGFLQNGVLTDDVDHPSG